MIKFDKYTFFGVPFFRKQSKAGTRCRIGIPVTIEKRENVNDVYLGTTGKYITHIEINGKAIKADEFSVIDSSYSERPTGFFSEEMPYGRKRGIYLIDSIEDSSWWCVKKSDLKSVGLELGNKIILDPGEFKTLPISKRYLIAQGEFSIGIEIKKAPIELSIDEEELTINAITHVIGLEFNKI